MKMTAAKIVIVNINLSQPRLVIFGAAIDAPAESSVGGCKSTSPTTRAEMTI